MLLKDEKNFKLIYLPIGVSTFDLKTAQEEFEKSSEMLKSIFPYIKVPDNMLLSLELLNDFIAANSRPDAVIVQNITFANSAYITEIAANYDCPVMLWSLRELAADSPTGRLRLNSLTGAFSAANALTSLSRRYDFVSGSSEEENTRDKIKAFISASMLKKAMSKLTILQVGHTPQGFDFGNADNAQMMKTFGVRLSSVELRELTEKAKNCSYDEIKVYLEDAKGRIKGLENIPEKNVEDFAKLYKVYNEYCTENNIGALSSRCWPDFFTSYGTPVCAVLAMMNDLEVPSACEADTYGALSMYISQYLTNTPSFFGDPVSLDKDENTITFWHCGTAACSLANEKSGACAGLHCNRKIGPTLEFGCKKCEKASVIRVGKKADGKHRIFISCGEILDKPKQFDGTTLVFRPKSNAQEIMTKAVKDGWEPHFAVAYGDIKNEIKSLGNMLNIEVNEF